VNHNDWKYQNLELRLCSLAQKIQPMKRKKPNLDTVTTINKDGSRFFLHPADVKGVFTASRRLVGYVLILLFVALPWIQVNGYPAVFLDTLNRRFHLFGFTLAAQDLWILFFLVTGLAFTLFFITALVGRIWCGWVCPQTVYLEHVYRRIERLIEGDAVQRRRLDRAPWTAGKVIRRLVKHILFIGVSLVIAHIFLSYFISLKELWQVMHHKPSEHLGLFGFVAAFTLVLYGNYTWFREQLCIVICPYGRFQSALIDAHTVNIGYDARRGEPRGAKRLNTDGDCIDCGQCIQVCPTGIDIRNGLQMECIGCANCIDVCNTVMKRVGRPVGLIRYDSAEAFSGGNNRWIRPRTLFYGVFLLIGISVASFSIAKITPVKVTAIRMPGMTYYVTDHVIRNQYQLRFINKQNTEAHFRLSFSKDIPGLSAAGLDQEVILPPMGEEPRVFVVMMDKHQYEGPFPLELTIQTTEMDSSIVLKLDFMGPDVRLMREHQNLSLPRSN
jgi:cytochrome c oxidase accessory protein FixG